jgi:hypothetical protein
MRRTALPSGCSLFEFANYGGERKMAADGEKEVQIRDLVNKLTDSKNNVLDSLQLKRLKALLKLSETSVQHAYETLQDKLLSKSIQVGEKRSFRFTFLFLRFMCSVSNLPWQLQTRELALELSDVLFTRSKTFRCLASKDFADFLDATVGHNSAKPLPEAPAAALGLRRKALEVVEKWHTQFGAQYPQVCPYNCSSALSYHAWTSHKQRSGACPLVLGYANCHSPVAIPLKAAFHWTLVNSLTF